MNFASANIDYVYGVEHIVRPGETVPAGTMEIFPGGKGLNQSVAAAKAGGCVYHAGFIGSAGENRIVVFQGTNGMFIREYIDPVLKGFPQGDILLLQNETTTFPI